jgi:peptidoglycan/LPS O-acetylase OafA/YrhL
MSVFDRPYVQRSAKAIVLIGQYIRHAAILLAGVVLAVVIALASLAVFCVVWPMRKWAGRQGGSGGSRRADAAKSKSVLEEVR